MPADVKHPRLSRFNKEKCVSEPVMVNHHLLENRWEWDDQWTPEQQKQLEKQQKEKNKCTSKK